MVQTITATVRKIGEERGAKDFQRAGCGVFLSLLNVPADPGKDFFLQKDFT